MPTPWPEDLHLDDSAYPAIDRTISGTSEYERWLHSYEVAWRDLSQLAELECEGCGELDLNLTFEVYEPGADDGNAHFWCGACLRGLFLCKAVIRPDHPTTPVGAHHHPNYDLIPPD